MKIKMFTTASGADFKAEAGQIVDVSEEFANELVSAGYAEFVDTPKKAVVIEKEKPAEEVETASYEPEQKAVRPKPKPKSRK